jgi:hypothetical protein
MKKKIEIYLTEEEEYALYQLSEKLGVNINDLISNTVKAKITEENKNT